ncbi:unnamed protein product [Dracunculus medinensis]|uniref:DNA-directed RNA polymerase n=1 Tax=Dracunculus medinensis TaxID=318479 RepID=A0A0N4UR50_DRAME|nr:unnamed protein product [Dracunculus medinensis]
MTKHILQETAVLEVPFGDNESDPFRRIGNLMVDWLRGSVVNSISLGGLETVISLTAIFDRLLFRVYSKMQNALGMAFGINSNHHGLSQWKIAYLTVSRAG